MSPNILCIKFTRVIFSNQSHYVIINLSLIPAKIQRINEIVALLEHYDLCNHVNIYFFCWLGNFSTLYLV